MNRPPIKGAVSAPAYRLLPMSPLSRGLVTVALLVCSNVFMTFAWYYHLGKVKSWPLVTAIIVSWLIALPEYMLQVPANRVGHASESNPGGVFTLPQLKILQEAITLVVFSVFAIVVMKERLRATDIAAFALVFMAVLISQSGRR